MAINQESQCIYFRNYMKRIVKNHLFLDFPKIDTTKFPHLNCSNRKQKGILDLSWPQVRSILEDKHSLTRIQIKILWNSEQFNRHYPNNQIQKLDSPRPPKFNSHILSRHLIFHDFHQKESFYSFYKPVYVYKMVNNGIL